jgi:hypothetical protein
MSKDLTGTCFGKQSSFGRLLNVSNRHFSNGFQGAGKVKKTFTIPSLVGMKRRMAVVLVLSTSTNQEKAVMVNLECELDTTGAGGIV